MTYRPEWEVKADGDLSELLKVPSAKEAPIRCRIPTGGSEVMSQEWARVIISSGTTTRMRVRQRREE